eukprot:CAMPEP_0116570222 /NCGR_PEP_ID=MMETSP0397-20121206/16809_1 /TAXON_ID=216820 /ORGANISM="Cyclophora tenuis, Strain ECT3854" /LENGTH=127 /DNA_ID=CAMNT_0004098033 /DNA_START=117 /DNA_END=497 /DNA_ORIENTATION=-
MKKDASLIPESDRPQTRMTESKKRMAAADALGALASLASAVPSLSDGEERTQSNQGESNVESKDTSTSCSGEAPMIEQPPAEASKENSPKDAMPQEPLPHRARFDERSQPEFFARVGYPGYRRPSIH